MSKIFISCIYIYFRKFASPSLWDSVNSHKAIMKQEARLSSAKKASDLKNKWGKSSLWLLHLLLNLFAAKITRHKWTNQAKVYRESVAGSVIQATGTVEFEDDLRTGVLPGGCWALRVAAPNLGSIPNPSGGAGWSWRQCGCHRDPLVRPNSYSAEFRASVVLNHSCYVVLGLNWP